MLLRVARVDLRNAQRDAAIGERVSSSAYTSARATCSQILFCPRASLLYGPARFNRQSMTDEALRVQHGRTRMPLPDQVERTN